ncbi:hypothetical protein XM53_18155 [Roseovarius atlanticus]|uniref:Uncharacterized protein n=1 Tax=Roseovarius atlanticus TaxID=1641875 RepID=A0A0T5NPX8_9RHOB|nr:hypothetical protein [Roseovarius atlanticus]KRS11005.1 hypothetical protein XM53_18155 [Roseovarius atlanticus]
MPEDLAPSFTDDTLRDPAIRSLAERMADDIIARSVMQSFEPKDQETVPMKDFAEPEWDSLVPPDMTDSFDFLL